MTPIEAIEAATRRALAAEEQEIEGWHLRSNPAVRARRANSATVPPHGDIEHAMVDVVVDWFRRRDRHPRIRMLSSADASLESLLDAAGWSRQDETLVMMSETPTLPPPAGEVLSGRDEVPPVWSGFRSALGLSSAAAHALHHLGRGEDVGYALVPDVTEPAGVGLGVLDGPLVGLYDVATAPAVRRRGVASGVVGLLWRWGTERGAVSAYLQVQADNEPAVRLYDKLGFTTLYTYWYRTPPDG